MAAEKEIKSRIAGVSDTKKITDAMYMISSAKMNRARRGVEEAEPYFAAVKQQISELFRHFPDTANRYFRVPDPAAGEHLKHGILLITSDKGLSGPYNRAATDMCMEYIGRHPETVLFIVGEYGRQYFASEGVPFVGDFRYSADMPTVWKARTICAHLLEYFDSGKADEINIIYTDYIEGRPAECKRNVLLPLTRSRFASPAEAVSQDSRLFYPDPDTVLSNIVPSYLTGFIYGSLINSYCSEQQARMTAMSEAGRNAERMLKDLNRRYNSVRQAAITSEMTEIAAGVRALRRRTEKDRQAEV